MAIPVGGVHPTQILVSGLAADLLVIDIAGVQVGDLIILGGQHIRRVLTAPANRLDKATRKFAFHTAPVAYRPDNPQPTGMYHASMGSAFLVLRPLPGAQDLTGPGG